MTKTEYSIPASLELFLDDKIIEAHDALAATELTEFWGTMPTSQIPYSDNAAEFVDLRPSDDHDSTAAIVLPFPFANGWAPHMAYRAKMLQNSLDTPTRLILFPNGPKSVSLNKEEKADVASGNFDALAERQLRTLEQLKIEKISYIGNSMGATLGACALKLAAVSGMFELSPSGLFEPPNVIGRQPRALQRQFIKSGKGLDDAVNGSGIPGLSEAQKSRGGIDVIRKNLGLLPFVLQTQSALNKAVSKGFTYPSFTNDMDMALERSDTLKVLVAAAQNSFITPAQFMAEMEEKAHNHKSLRVRLVEEYGHEMADNIIVHAILGKIALAGRS